MTLDIKKLFRLALAACGMSFLPACGGGDDAGDVVVVSVGDAVLTRTQLMSALPVTASAADSAVFADEYIRGWVYRQVLLQKATLYLSNETEEIDEAVDEYRSSLIIEMYQNKLVEQKFKPDITNDDIHAYYEQMKQNFVLTDPLIKGCFAIIPSGTPDIRDFVKTLIRFDEESSLEVEEYMFHNATKYKSSFDAWLSMAAVRNFFPAGSLPEDVRSLTKVPVLKVEEGGNVYILKVTHALPAGAIAPEEFVRKDITNILVSKRKLKFLSSANKDIYEQAVKSNAIKFYDNND